MVSFSPNKMQIEKYKVAISFDPSFKKCFRKNITDIWWDDIKSKDHIILYIFGETDTFKSSVAQEIAKAIEPSFKADQIVFDNSELLNVFKTSKPKMNYIRDESPDLYGAGAGRINSMILLLAEALRQRGNGLIFVCPTQKGTNLIESCHYNLRTIPPLSDCGKFIRLGVLDPQTQSYLGYILIKITFNTPMWKEYQKRKGLFLEKVPQGMVRTINIEEMAKEALCKIDVKIDINRTERRLRLRELFPNISIAEQDQIAIRMEQILRINDFKKPN